MANKQFRVIVDGEIDDSQHVAGVVLVDANGDPIDLGGGGGPVAWADISGKPTTFPPVVGTTATTAKAGNYVPAWADVTGKPTIPAAVAAGTAAQLTAGTDTVQRTWSAKDLAEFVAAQVVP